MNEIFYVKNGVRPIQRHNFFFDHKITNLDIVHSFSPSKFHNSGTKNDRFIGISTQLIQN